MANIVFSVDRDQNGELVVAREYLKGPTSSEPGASVIGATAGTYVKLSLSMNPKFPYLQGVDAVCLVDGVSEAEFSVVGASGATIPLKKIRSGKVPVAGDQIQLAFATPVSIADAAQELHIRVDSASGGNWFIQPNGFYSAVKQTT